MYKLNIIELFVAINLAFLTETFKGDVISQTKFGRVRGGIRFALESNRPVYSYFGIPYARSPHRAHRFRPPVDPAPWTDVKDTSEEETVPLCLQDKERLGKLRRNTLKQFLIPEDAQMQEDCLTVDIFSPIHPSEVPSKTPLPVLFWVHGGSLQTASTPRHLWMLPGFEHVILVAVQYRLGPFGFLNLNDSSARANLGLRDQVKALQWVKENIASFGGDPTRVALWGQSAGGFCVSALTLSPRARGLFHRVIAMSGIAVKPSSWGRDQVNKTYNLLQDLNCKLKTNEESMECMRLNVTASEIITATRRRQYAFLAQEDGDFFPTPVKTSFERGMFDFSVPIMMGAVSGEFDFLLGRKRVAGYTTEGERFSRRAAEKRVLEDVENYYPHLLDRREIVDELLHEYLGDAQRGFPVVRGLVDYLADSQFHSNIFQAAQRITEGGGQVYFYHFAHQPAFYSTEPLRIRRPFDFRRADHSDDIALFLGFPFLPLLSRDGIEFTAIERDLSRRLMHAVTTFAASGEPMIGESRTWKTFPRCLSIDHSLNLTSDFRKTRMKLWQRVASTGGDSRGHCKVGTTAHPDAREFCEQ